MVGRIQRNKARSIASWAYAAHSVDSAKLIAALDRAAAGALAEGVRSDPLRIYIQLSLDGDVDRGGVDIARPDLVDELCAQVESAEGLEFVGLMAHPAARVRIPTTRSRVCRPSTSGYRVPTSSVSSCRRECPATSRRPSNMVRRVCVSVPRYWGNVL